MADLDIELRTDGLAVYSQEIRPAELHTFGRKDCYEIKLLTGTGTVYCGNRLVKIMGSVLLITTPGRFCSWSISHTHLPSYTCVIAREFLHRCCFKWLPKCQIFSSDNSQFLEVSTYHSRFLVSLFERMIGAQQSVYPLRNALMQDQFCVLIHTALRLNPTENFVELALPATSPTKLVRLVEMMFPSEAQVLHSN